MKRKMKAKSKTASKLKSKRLIKDRLRSKKTASRKSVVKVQKKPVTTKVKTQKKVAAASKKIVRIMGHGQFTVDSRTLKKLNEIDNTLVEIVSKERSDDNEFKKRLSELNDMVMKNGKPLDPHEIIKSDIILPSADLSIDEAKKLFQGDGVIPEI
jgi:hypothetical protein